MGTLGLEETEQASVVDVTGSGPAARRGNASTAGGVDVGVDGRIELGAAVIRRGEALTSTAGYVGASSGAAAGRTGGSAEVINSGNRARLCISAMRSYCANV